MSSPVFKLLYYKSVLNRSMLRFFEENGEKFTKDRFGRYVYAGQDAETTLSRFIMNSTLAEISSLTPSWDATRPEYVMIIGGCEPRDNMLLDFADGYFPAKLRRTIWADSRLKYALKERDILVDTAALNAAADQVFEKLFSSRPRVRNLIFVKHRNLDCYAMFKTLKFILGKRSCVNMHSERFADDRQCVIAVNDLIDRYVNGKCAMNSSGRYRAALEEVRQFIEGKLNGN